MMDYIFGVIYLLILYRIVRELNDRLPVCS